MRTSLFAAALGGLIALNAVGVRAWDAANAPATAGAETQLAASFVQLPLHFERNQGQAEPQIRFLARGEGYTIAVRDRGQTDLMLQRRGERPERLRLSWTGARATAAEGKDLRPGKTHYLIGNDARRWHRNIDLFGAVTYDRLYPGIDLRLYGNQRALEYDLIVEPGADLSQVRLQIDGASSLRLADDGDVTIRTPSGGELVQRAPQLYQERGGARVAVAGRYRLEGRNALRFSASGYDRSLALVVDPVLHYSTYLGGDAGDIAHAVALDSAAKTYVTGQTASTDFTSASNALATAPDAFVAKMQNDGKGLLYSVYVGGSANDIAFAIAVDSTGSAFIAGQTNSIDLPGPSGGGGIPNGCQPVKTAGTDAFVIKLTPDASDIVYSSYLGGGGTDVANAVALDGIGNVYVAGQTGSAGFPQVTGKPNNGFQTVKGSGNDGFIVKIDATSAGSTSLLYHSFYGGGRNDIANGLAVDASAALAYMAGQTNSASIPAGTATPYNGSNSGGVDAFAAVVDVGVGASGPSSLIYSSYFGASGIDRARGVGFGTGGDIYITGDTDSTTLPAAGTPIQPGYGGGASDAFLARLDPTLGASGLEYFTYVGGAGPDIGHGVAVVGETAYLVGESNSTSGFPVTTNALQFAKAGNIDTFGSRIDTATGSNDFSTFLGGSLIDIGRGIAVDPGGFVLVVGSTNSTDFPTNVPGSGDPVSGNKPGNDAFVARLKEVNPGIAWITPADPVVWEEGSTHFIKWGHNLGKYSFVRLDVSKDAGPYTMIPGAGAVSNRTNATSTTFTASQFKWIINVNPLPTGSSVQLKVTWTSNTNVLEDSIVFTVCPVGGCAP